jgi:hypothetical protein
LPIDGEGGWLSRCARTLGRLVVAPRASFSHVSEPIDHARVLAFLATLRLPGWILAVVLLLVSALMEDPAVPHFHPPSVATMALGLHLSDVLSRWLLLMIPIGLPLLYFFGGLLAHMSLAMTGGARRSVGTSMRAFGLALAPAMPVLSVFDVLLYNGWASPEIWAVSVLIVSVLGFVILSVALAGTHRAPIVRGVLVGLIPIVFFVAITGGRGTLELPRLPWQPAPELSPYAPFEIVD